MTMKTKVERRQERRIQMLERALNALCVAVDEHRTAIDNEGSIDHALTNSGHPVGITDEVLERTCDVCRKLIKTNADFKVIRKG